MLVVVQFPICDSRAFSTTARRLSTPDWPSPRYDVNPQFVRSFGRAWRRRLGGNPLWFGETVHCSANRALRFAELRPHLFVNQPNVVPWSAFRRLISDGRVATRVEIGVGVGWHSESGGTRDASPYDVDALSVVREVAGLQRSFRLTPSSRDQWWARARTFPVFLLGPRLQ
jgi:hypothetical protein